MKLISIIALVFLMLSGCGDVTGSSEEGIKVAVYSGDGAATLEVTALVCMFSWMGYDVSAVGPNFILGSGISKYNIIVFPGGDPAQFAADMGESGIQKIREFVQDGGGYIGVCGGAMFACEAATWNGAPMELDFLEIFKGDANGPADAGTPGFWTMERFDLTNHPICTGLADTMWVLFNNNPHFIPDNSSYKVALFSGSGQCGFAGCDYGNGRVFVMGPMPQFEENSDRDSVDVFDELDDRESDWPFMQNVCSWILKDIQ